MNITREALHHLIDVANTDRFGDVFRILMESLPEDKMLPDEEEEIIAGRKEIENGEYYTVDEINWE
ncbi:MAG: hypothetical protein LBC56_03095 [Oscillospiraceae bacterium]|jgi:hypothetical protein|nr:hypothetical protein [Oscillospiraceae bacterium]